MSRPLRFAALALAASLATAPPAGAASDAALVERIESLESELEIGGPR